MARFGVLVAGVFAAIGASCATESAGAPDTNELRSSGVGVVAEGCGTTAQLASGVVVDGPGQVVTVAHALAGATAISVVDATGRVRPATVRAFDKDRDLAVLAVPGLDAPALGLAPPAVGAAATLTWRRDGGVTYDAVDIAKRLAITIEDIYVEEIVERQGIEVVGDIGVGDSGGAVVSTTGEVIGIIYASSRERDGIGFATDSTEVEAVLATTSGTDVANGRCN